MSLLQLYGCRQGTGGFLGLLESHGRGDGCLFDDRLRLDPDGCLVRIRKTVARKKEIRGASQRITRHGGGGKNLNGYVLPVDKGRLMDVPYRRL